MSKRIISIKIGSDEKDPIFEHQITNLIQTYTPFKQTGERVYMKSSPTMKGIVTMMAFEEVMERETDDTI